MFVCPYNSRNGTMAAFGPSNLPINDPEWGCFAETTGLITDVRSVIVADEKLSLDRRVRSRTRSRLII
jgi:hypothetical protein